MNTSIFKTFTFLIKLVSFYVTTKSNRTIINILSNTKLYVSILKYKHYLLVKLRIDKVRKID